MEEGIVISPRTCKSFEYVCRIGGVNNIGNSDVEVVMK